MSIEAVPIAGISLHYNTVILHLKKNLFRKHFLRERERERENQRDVYDLYMNRGEGRGSFTFDTSVCT